MIDQPLHDFCDEMYSQIHKNKQAIKTWEADKIVATYLTLIEWNKRLERSLVTLREQALRSEGEKEI